MKKTVQFLLLALFLVSFSTSFAQMHMDGDNADWADLPVLIDAPNNVDGMFPPEVGALVTDVVDIKSVKATVIGNVLYGYLEMWAGPAWPNNAYENDHEGTIYYESRGYYHLLLDIDNDATTGWNTAWYEAHYTPVGYLISTGQALEPIGAEVMTEWGSRTNDDWKVANEAAVPVRNISYWAADYEEYDGQTDNGSDYEIYNQDIPMPDSAKMMSWEGALMIDSSDDPALIGGNKYYWSGHGWGNDFIEFGMELTPYQMYYKNKDGRTVMQPGDVIGLCGMVETPIDDWGVDLTTRGEVTIPNDVTMRPHRIKFDGDDSDWSDFAVLIDAPNNVDGMFPPEVGALVTDVVDIKEVKAFMEGDNFYYNLKLWAGPAWPNNAYENDHEGTIYYESRGYYHVLLDLDNDATTGWNTAWYEAHYTPVGYLISTGQALEPIGAEVMLEWGARTNDSWKVANEAAVPVRNISYWAADYEEYDGQTDNGSDYEIYNFDVSAPDSASMMSFDGILVNNSSDDPLTMDGNPDWKAHAWGNDFIESGESMRAIKEYYKNKDGREVFKVGDVIGICGMVETPIDDWGVDLTTRGEVNVIVGVNDSAPEMVQEFALANNYPNPFNPSTKIEYSLPTSEYVSLKVYDIIGREVATLVSTQQNAGTHKVEFNASNLTSGVYFYKIEAGSFASVKKMLLLK